MTPSTQTPLSPAPDLERRRVEIALEPVMPPAVQDWPSGAPQTRAKPRLALRWLVVVGLAAVGVLAWWALNARGSAQGTALHLFQVARRSFPIVLQEKGELKAANSIDIKSELEGRATIIHLVEEGTRVKPGELLVELASDQIDEKIRDTEIKEATAAAAYEAAAKERDILRDEDASKIRKAELDLRIAGLALEKYTQGERKELEQAASLAVDKARSVLNRAKEDLKDSEELFKQGFITRIELEDDRFAEYEAQMALQTATLAFDVLGKYTVPMSMEEKSSDVQEKTKELERARKSAEAAEAKADADVDAKKASLDLVREQLAKARDQKSKSRIVAPTAGLVVYARDDHWGRSETNIETGAQVFERQSLIELPDTRQMKAKIKVHEAQIEQLKVGMPALVEIEGFAGRHFRGQVSKIGVLADSQNRWLNPNLKQYETEITLEGEFTELKPNTTARVEIRMAQLDNVLAVPVQAVFGKGNRFFVFVDEGGQAKPVEVRPGLSSNEYVEIKTGLQEGQAVYLAVTDQMRPLLPDDDGGPGNSEAGRRKRTVEEPAAPPPSPEPVASPGEPGQAARPDTAKPDTADRGPGASSSRPAGGRTRGPR